MISQLKSNIINITWNNTTTLLRLKTLLLSLKTQDKKALKHEYINSILKDKTSVLISNKIGDASTQTRFKSKF